MVKSLVLTSDIIAVLVVLAITIVLFITEVVRVDVAAILIMVLLGVTGMVPSNQLFNGFAGNAVISIIAIMIIGSGLDKTGVMSKVAAFILRVGGSTERRVMPLVSGSVGFISSFMQNVGAAALFLPVVARISARTRIPMSRLLMPMGFSAILGGTMTMVGSSPLILLNDLILTSNQSLQERNIEPMATFGLFEVTPVGIALILTGIVYFMVAARFILPITKGTEIALGGDTMDYFRKVYGIEGELFEVRVPASSRLRDFTVEAVEKQFPGVFMLALSDGDELLFAPPGANQVGSAKFLAVMGTREVVERFVEANGLELSPQLMAFAEVLSPTIAGISEVVVPPGSNVIGNTLRDVRMRKTYGTSVLALYRGTQCIRENVRDLVIQAGDTLVVHARWADVAGLDKDRNFVVATDYPREETRPHKVSWALFFFAVALGLVLFSDLRLSVALLVGAMGMVVSGVLRMDEAYEAVSWKTVFLLASLIPLGMAVESSGTAAWIAQETLRLLDGVPVWVLELTIALLGTFFSLVMSNVGATVLLVPLAVNIALGAGADPRVFALIVGLATSNSFLIPTHQVNALIMGPAGYRVVDFLRAGGIMTVLFLVVMLLALNFVF